MYINIFLIYIYVLNKHTKITALSRLYNCRIYLSWIISNNVFTLASLTKYPGKNTLKTNAN